MEESSADDLHADEREEEYADAQSVSGGLHHFFRVCSEEAYERLSEEGAKHESGGADDGRGYHGIVQYLYETVVALCSIVVSCNLDDIRTFLCTFPWHIIRTYSNLTILQWVAGPG